MVAEVLLAPGENRRGGVVVAEVRDEEVQEAVDDVGLRARARLWRGVRLRMRARTVRTSYASRAVSWYVALSLNLSESQLVVAYIGTMKRMRTTCFCSAPSYQCIRCCPIW